MSKIKLDYKVENKLDLFINREIGRRMMGSGIKVTKSHIINEVAIYCGVGKDNINRIKRNISQPSLAVSLKIAEYFNVKVEDIFKIS